MKLLFNYLKNFKWLIVGAMALAAINQIASLFDPQIFRMIIDRYAMHAREMEVRPFVRGVLLLLGASVGVAFISRVAKNIQDYIVNMITQRLGARLYGDAVAHAFSLPYAVFEDQRSGELLKKLDKARLDAQTFVKSCINTVFLSAIGISFVIIYAFTVHWAVGLIYSFIVPSLALFLFVITRRIKKIQSTIVRQTAELAGSTTETLRNVALVKSLGLEGQEISHLNTVNDRILQLELGKIKTVRKLEFTQGTMINALRASLLFVMLWLMYTGALTFGQFFTLYIYSFFILSPLAELGSVATQYQETRASMESLDGILKMPSAPKNLSGKRIGELQGISLKNISFSYPSGEQKTLHDVSLEIPAGKTTAFVGPSGSGKTTVIKLITGLYEPTQGTLAFNDVEAKEIDFDALRMRIGLVSQDTQLFAGTIRENLLFVRPDASDEDLKKVLSASAADAILARSSAGLNTKIGEGGIKLSGGEKQRLAIARALLRNPDIMIFDEATSSLDSLTEKSITETTKDIIRLRPHAITILVAHRLSTIMHADTIHVLENGGVIEHGTHAQLVKKNGLYAAMWREQSAA